MKIVCTTPPPPPYTHAPIIHPCTDPRTARLARHHIPNPTPPDIYALLLHDTTANVQIVDVFIFQVSSSCTSVYVDGSETRGALSAQIDVKYGQQVGKALVS